MTREVQTMGGTREVQTREVQTIPPGPSRLQTHMHTVSLVGRGGPGPVADRVQRTEGEVEARLEVLQPAGEEEARGGRRV